MYNMACPAGIKCTATICSLHKARAKDCDSQLQFCRCVPHKNVDEPDFLSRVQWTVEAELLEVVKQNTICMN
jgi:hypothetical protein